MNVRAGEWRKRIAKALSVPHCISKPSSLIRCMTEFFFLRTVLPTIGFRCEDFTLAKNLLANNLPANNLPVPQKNVIRKSLEIRPEGENSCPVQIAAFNGNGTCVPSSVNYSDWNWLDNPKHDRMEKWRGRHCRHLRAEVFIEKGMDLSLIHIWRCRRSTLCRSRWSPYH